MAILFVFLYYVECKGILNMTNLSIEKMQEIRKTCGLTYEQLAQNTGISRSTIEKIFGGFNKNPTLSYLKKIAESLNCSVEDFFEWESEPTSPYYLDRKTAELAQEIHDNPEYRMLLDASRYLKPDDLKAVIDIANRIKGTYNG